MTSNFKQIIGYRRQEEEIRKAEVELAQKKCDLIKLRQGCKHNVQIVLENKKYSHCALCGQRFKTNETILEAAEKAEIIKQDENSCLILDSTKYWSQYLEEERIVRIEVTCAEHIYGSATMEEKLQKIQNDLKDYEN